MIDRDVRVVDVAAIHDLAAPTRTIHHNLVAIPDAHDASQISTAIMVEIASNGQ